MVQDDLRIRYNTRGNDKIKGCQTGYYDDREEHEGHRSGNYSGIFLMTVRLAG